MELLDLCYDVLIRILEEVEPEDLLSCASTSWAFNNFIKGNKRLFKHHYLKNYDDLHRRPTDMEPDWISEIQKLTKCQRILASNSAETKKTHFSFVASTIDNLLQSASDHCGESLNRSRLSKIFENPRNLDAFMYRSSLYQRAGTESQNENAADNEEDQQLSAKLHCLYGVPLGPIGRRSLSTHPWARAHVYDLRNYTDKTRWGPWRDDGSMRVDWEMLESIMIVLGYNSGTCCQRFTYLFKPLWCEPFGGIVRNNVGEGYPPSLPMELDLPLELKDPYNVSGIWLRIVCFLDYNDLYALNFASRIPSDQPRGPITTEEAIRHIMMRIKVTAVEAPGQFDNPNLPIVHFSGTSRSMDASWDPNANSRIRGKVRLTPSDEVRWTTISIFHGGEEKWRSEGVQVGGPNSARGVIGTWFDKDYDPHGPAGPTAFWKMSDKSLIADVQDESSEDEDGW
ncbi:hypothetical protein P154DRAFT_524017 [Amniculicola lignicola CBS 123094]|uniref:F-box domain-containing protein n=1 Tax=Amniculicola lignicola CBS 123094 TaxID=1392246 RepID=A0A6A5WLN1_9PLEO|nr:hypothetical protein P154DRAFT_524017 [Amniculicola lignicola CBS 123094]